MLWTVLGSAKHLLRPVISCDVVRRQLRQKRGVQFLPTLLFPVSIPPEFYVSSGF
jgi:hypothetical protein